MQHPLRERYELYILAAFKQLNIELVKELEKRILEIEKGEMETLHGEYDYQAKILRELGGINNFNKAMYAPKIKQLLEKVMVILERKPILTKVAIRVHDENWSSKTPEEHIRNYRDFGKKLKFDFDRPNFDYTLLFLGVNPNDGNNIANDWVTKYISAPTELIEQVEKAVSEELLTYKDVFVDILGIKPPIQANEVESLEAPHEGDDDVVSLKIKAKLAGVKDYFSSRDFDRLVSALHDYPKKGRFPEYKEPIDVVGCDNIKRIGWAITRAFKTFNIRKYPDELFAFAKHNISIFKDVHYCPSDRQKCNVYKYMTENPDKYRKPR